MGNVYRSSYEIMPKHRDADKDVDATTDPDTGPITRRRFRRLAAAAGKYRMLFAFSTTLVVVLSFVLLGLILTDGPERVPLGEGRAGILDTVVTADTLGDGSLDAPATGSERAAAGEDVASELPDGDASYYGDELAGRPTASGETFDPGRLTAAHRTLPLGTRLRVTNVRNGRSVVVRVNDRGPFSGNRVLDLSYSAARQIGMIQSGQARVRMEVLR